MIPSRKMARRRLPLILALAVLIAFLPVLRNGFVWDDEQYILDNTHVTGGLTPENLRWAFTAFRAGNWHPLTWISHMADVELFGLRPWGHHLVNILIHVANTVILFHLLRGLTGALWRSFFVAALFGVHPLHVESVAWVAERKDLLSTLLGFGAIGAYLRYLRRPAPPAYAGVVLLFAAGLMAKPMLVTLPFVLLLLDAWPLGRLRPSFWRGPVLEKAPLLLLSAASSVVTFQAQVSAGAYSDYSLGVRVSNALVAYARYLAKMVAPVNLAVFYPHPEVMLPPWQVLGALLGLGLATILVALGWRRRPWLAVGWFWFGGTLVPVIGLVQVGQQAIADRYTYLPLIGVFLAAAWGLDVLMAKRPSWRATLIGAAAAVAFALAVATWIQAGHWRDPVRLFSHAIRSVPGNWLAHYNIGVYFQERGRTDEAAAHYREALKIKPEYEKALNNFGTILEERGRFAEAVAHYRAALAATPGYADALGNLGAVLMKQGRFREAEPYFNQALRVNPDFYEAYMNLAELMLREQRWAESAAQFSAAVRLSPGSVRGRKGLGVALARQGRYQEAVPQFREALRLDPSDRDAADNLDLALSRLRR